MSSSYNKVVYFKCSVKKQHHCYYASLSMMFVILKQNKDLIIKSISSAFPAACRKANR